jgi:hypothetical protein
MISQLSIMAGDEHHQMSAHSVAFKFILLVNTNFRNIIEVNRSILWTF